MHWWSMIWIVDGSGTLEDIREIVGDIADEHGRSLGCVLKRTALYVDGVTIIDLNRHFDWVYR